MKSTSIGFTAFNFLNLKIGKNITRSAVTGLTMGICDITTLTEDFRPGNQNM